MIINASTGVIGQIIPIEPFEEHMKELAGGLSADGNDKAANAIMTTDTVDKQVAVEFTLGGQDLSSWWNGKGKRYDPSEYGNHAELYHNGCCNLSRYDPEGSE